MLIPVAADLETVTSVGPEADPAEVGLSRAVCDALWQSVCDWYRLGTTPAIQVCLRRRGAVVLNRAIGHAWGNAPTDPPDADKVLLRPETPLCGFSTAKGVAIVVMFLLMEQGFFALDDPVCEHIPEFAAHGKETITIGDVMSHAAGVPFVTPPHRGRDLVSDEKLAVVGLADLVPSWGPRRFRVYHALTSGLIMRLLVQRATGKRMREHLAERVLGPLGFRWTNFGVRPEDLDAVAPSVRTGPPQPRVARFLASKALGGAFDGPMGAAAEREFLTTELPSGNLVTTAFELSRFYEILRLGGTLDGVEVLRPDSVRTAIRPDRWMPGVAGRVSVGGYELGARRSKFGRHTETHFGRSGLTTQYGWADPARGLSGAILTSGKSRLDTDRPWRLCAQIAALVPRLEPADWDYAL